MTFNFLGPGLTVNVEAKVKEQIILDSSDSDVALVCVGQTLIAIAVLGALFYSHIPWLAISSMSLAAFGYFFISGPMQALIIAGAGDAKVILAALGQIAYNGANAIGAFLGGEAIRHYGFAISAPFREAF